jgi:glycosyltransferase involved in cell wall biosynthesis
MKVLIVNSRYFPSAGPEKYLFTVSRLLEEHGHEVIPFSLRNRRNVDTPYARYFADNIGGGDELFFEEMDSSLRTKFQILDRQFYSFHVRRKLEQLVTDTRPDIAYVLHHQNRLSPSVIDACKRHGVPVVVRISDFSLICARNNFLRDGQVCELCLEKGIHQSIKYKCVKDSTVASVIKAAALAYYRMNGFYGRVDRIVVPSRFSIEKLASVLDTEKLVYLPTCISPLKPYTSGVGKYALFVGRVEEEKGLQFAIEASARVQCPLKIVGYSHTGYMDRLREHVRAHKFTNVEFIGPKYGAELEKLYMDCRFVILPVIWYENLPNVALEAMVHGKPIVASDIGSMRETIRHGQNGLLFQSGSVDACAAAMSTLLDDDDLCRKLGRAGHERAASDYSPEQHYERLMQVFAEAGVSA